MKIQIREEEKQISFSHLSQAVGINSKKLIELLESKQQGGAVYLKETCSKNDLNKILHYLNINSEVLLSKEKKRSWDSLLESKICIESNGIFLIDPSSNYDEPLFKNLINEYGIWNAQGFNNHEHINDYVTNPIAQIYLAEKVISNYVNQLKELKHPGKGIIYWNGNVDSTVCIYLQKDNDESFLKKVDNQLGITKISITNM